MKKKTLAMLLSAALVISATAFGSIAYLTDTATIVNTFTVGNVVIKVEETRVNEQGQPVDENGDVIHEDSATEPVKTTEGNAYHLMPGQRYTKDPAMTVAAGSEESYVRMLVTITHIDELKRIANVADGQHFLPENYVKDADGQSTWDSTVWPCVSITEGTETVTDTATGESEEVAIAVYEFRYKTTVAGVDENGASADVPLEPLFTSFTVPGELTGEQLAMLQDMEIRVMGQAIQAAGFEDEAAAWAAFPTNVTFSAETEETEETEETQETEDQESENQQGEGADGE